MASGDTISGKLRVVRIDTEGNQEIIAGPFGAGELDDVNQNFSPEDYLYLNTSMTSRKSAPLQAREVTTPGAQFQSGERLLVQFKANQTVANDVDVSADAWTVEILRRDKNRNRVYPDTLTVADQEVSANVGESDTEFKTIFQETVPDRTEYRMAGRLAAAAIEA